MRRSAGWRLSGHYDPGRAATRGCPYGVMMNFLALAIAAVAARIGKATVALTGGCFQNARLTEAAVTELRAAGLTPWWHERVPANDGGLALGQAMVAMARAVTGSSPDPW